MSRKKNAKGSAKRQQGSLVALQKIEKDFWQTPSKWAAQLNQEIKSLKQKQNKLKAALNKNQTQTDTFAKRLKNAPKNTSTGKKQWTAAKRAHAKSLSSQTDLAKQLKAITNSLETTNNAQAKFSALHQHLNQFQKNWTKKSKSKKVKSKSKPKQLEAKPSSQEPKIETAEVTDNFVRYETDVTS